MNPGRPTLYTEEVGKEICARLAEGESLRAICQAEHMPAESTVRAWALAADHPISAQFASARELGYFKMAEDLLDIADDGTNDFVEKVRESGEKYVVGDHEHIQRSKLRVDTRKWILSKMLPKVYGEKVQTEVTGKDGGPIEVADALSDIERARRIAFLLRNAAEKATDPTPANKDPDAAG